MSDSSLWLAHFTSATHLSRRVQKKSSVTDFFQGAGEPFYAHQANLLLIVISTRQPARAGYTGQRLTWPWHLPCALLPLTFIFPHSTKSSNWVTDSCLWLRGGQQDLGSHYYYTTASGWNTACQQTRTKWSAIWNGQKDLEPQDHLCLWVWLLGMKHRLRTAA